VTRKAAITFYMAAKQGHKDVVQFLHQHGDR
jgi:hypothetical protein